MIDSKKPRGYTCSTGLTSYRGYNGSVSTRNRDGCGVAGYGCGVDFADPYCTRAEPYPSASQEFATQLKSLN
jgi:hypothetical protein